MMFESRADHIAMCKAKIKRDTDGLTGLTSWILFREEMEKHPETAFHIGLELGDALIAAVLLSQPNGSTVFDMPGPFNLKRLIKNFN